VRRDGRDPQRGAGSFTIQSWRINCTSAALDGDDAQRIADLERESRPLLETFGHRTPNGRHAVGPGRRDQ
jgi:hypothetical protein